MSLGNLFKKIYTSVSFQNTTFFIVLLSVFIGITGVIGKDGGAYSSHSALRLQTEAYLNGNISISNDIKDLRDDMIWFDNGLHHVWGLGVPALRLPFEILGRAFTNHSFPDRVTFVFYVFVSMLVLYKCLTVVFSEINPKYKRFFSLVGVSLVFLFPPFISLMRTRFLVYEEVIAYGYLYTVTLLSLFSIFLFRKTLKYWYLISIVSSGALFIRPTLGAYSFVIFLISFFLAIKNKNIKYKHIFFGLLIFVFGNGLLFYTNIIRFGGILEFGHTVNIGLNPTMVNATHFGTSFSEESSIKKIGELSSALFLVEGVPEKNNAFKSGLFPLQSEYLRWRYIYFPTFHIWNIVTLILMSVLFFHFKKHNLKELRYIIFATITSFFLLFIFYLNNGFISSRYFLDFGGAIVSSILFCVFWFLHFSFRRKVWAVCSLFLFALILSSNYVNDVFGTKKPQQFNPKKLNVIIDSSKIRSASKKFLGSEYEIGDNLRDYGIVYNGNGWKSVSGELSDLAMFVVYSPNDIEFNFDWENTLDIPDFSEMRVKIGTEELKMKSKEINDSYAKIIFSAPQNKNYKQGYQLLFVSFSKLTKSKVDKPDFNLQSIKW